MKLFSISIPISNTVIKRAQRPDPPVVAVRDVDAAAAFVERDGMGCAEVIVRPWVVIGRGGGGDAGVRVRDEGARAICSKQETVQSRRFILAIAPMTCTTGEEQTRTKRKTNKMCVQEHVLNFVHNTPCC